MEKIKLCDDVIGQIKDFDPWYLTKEQELIVDKLISNDELKTHCYKYYCLCKECKQPNTSYYWCQSCVTKHFQQNFNNWTRGNHDIDEFIRNAQLKAKNDSEVLEWIEYDRFENIEYLTKREFGTAYKAIWKDGYISGWDYENNKLIRN